MWVLFLFTSVKCATEVIISTEVSLKTKAVWFGGSEIGLLRKQNYE